MICSTHLHADSDRLLFVTGNKNKLEEVRAILSKSKVDIEVESVKLDLPELQGADPVDIAREKCKTAMKLLPGEIIITEDTCLCFNALSGLPGPYIKWFLQKLGHDGLNRMLQGWEDKSAYACCIFALGGYPGQDPNEPLIFEGRTNGRIVEARGPPSFGWDPIFVSTY